MPEEGSLIKEATDKGVHNVARYYHHETVQFDGRDDNTIANAFEISFLLPLLFRLRFDRWEFPACIDHRCCMGRGRI